MITVNNEHYTYKRISRVENSPYEYTDVEEVFKGRPANRGEVRNYRVQQGINGNQSSVFIISSNLPDIHIGDRVEFLGKLYIVQSVGYYYDEGRIVNPSLMSEEYISARCPKGINIQ